MLQGVPVLSRFLMAFLCPCAAVIHRFTSVSFPSPIWGRGMKFGSCPECHGSQDFLL